MNLGAFLLMANDSRSILVNEVNEMLCHRVEIRSFMTAWEVISERFDGVSRVDENLDPIPFIHSCLKKELKKNGMVTEEVFVSWLMELPVIGKSIVGKNTGIVWEPQFEAFSEFEQKVNGIIVNDVQGKEVKLKQYYDWIIGLCDWKCSNYVGFGLRDGKKTVH